MKKTIALLSITLGVGGNAHSSAPEAWAAHYDEVAASCVKASGLRDARAAGDFVDFDDRVGYTALVVEGYYPPPHMKNRMGRILCLFDKRSRTSYVSGADALIQSSGR